MNRNYVHYTLGFAIGLLPIRPPMRQAEVDAELTMWASPDSAIGQLTLTQANWRCSTVQVICIW